ncbi:MAG: carboxylating nicotinate-nucleotide diphosphorylase [Blastocatellia bacterium AA13]|nr:MAG: carboxylating nicotinate-nucleotide diphosphorylase [Blastocatellia bacterium AA13]
MDLDPGVVFSIAAEFLREDLGRGDITTQAIVRGGARARGRFLAKQDLILCGLEIAEAVFASLDGSIQVESHSYDGDAITSGTEFARIEGPAAVLLSGERTALNLLQHLSGIATITRRFADAISDTAARVVDTRKTAPGLRMLEKYAVTVGGGFNHRFGLDDGVIIKDNHIAIAGGVRRAVEITRRSVSHLMKIEVEVSRESQVLEAIEAGADVIMLDNMSLADMTKSVTLISEKAPATIIEASGGVTLETIRAIAECGVNMISVGALTHSAPAVDISLKIASL